MTRKEILDLRPEFEFGEMVMVMIDWFNISEGAGGVSIHSGLRHADGETKSPFYYDNHEFGENAEEICIEKFTNWWNALNYKK